MKIKSFLTMLIVITLCSCNHTKKTEFLYLNGAQLNKIGINLSDQGVFYKNINPNWKQDNKKYAFLAFYCCDDNYVSSMHMDETDTLVVKSKTDSLLKTIETTRNDFYPLLIGDTKGIQSLNEDLPKDMKLLPIAICMSETKLPNRKDTVVVWLKPTELLRQFLPENINMDDYLQTKPSEK